MAAVLPNTATSAELDAGAVLQRMDAGRSLSDAELEQHIADCRLLMERAYARHQAHQSPVDRDEAVFWMHHFYGAVGRRRPEVKQAMEAEALRRVEESVGYFLDQADRDRLALARRGDH